MSYLLVQIAVSVKPKFEMLDEIDIYPAKYPLSDLNCWTNGTLLLDVVQQ